MSVFSIRLLFRCTDCCTSVTGRHWSGSSQAALHDLIWAKARRHASSKPDSSGWSHCLCHSAVEHGFKVGDRFALQVSCCSCSHMSEVQIQSSTVDWVTAWQDINEFLGFEPFCFQSFWDVNRRLITILITYSRGTLLLSHEPADNVSGFSGVQGLTDNSNIWGEIISRTNNICRLLAWELLCKCQDDLLSSISISGRIF